MDGVGLKSAEFAEAGFARNKEEIQGHGEISGVGRFPRCET